MTRFDKLPDPQLYYPCDSDFRTSGDIVKSINILSSIDIDKYSFDLSIEENYPNKNNLEVDSVDNRRY